MASHLDQIFKKIVIVYTHLMNTLTIESKIIIFGPLFPISYKLAHENDETQLANYYTTTFVLLCWLFLTLSF